MKHHLVYVTTNLVNGKQYVGVHSTNDLNDGYIGSGTLLKKKIEEYGQENFKQKILFDCKLRVTALWIESLIIQKWVIDLWGNGKYFYNKIEGGLFPNKKLTNDEFLIRLKNKHKDNVIPLEGYVNCNTKILFKCNNCENTWKTCAGYVIGGNGCPKCNKKKGALKSAKKNRLSNDTHLKRLFNVYGNAVIPLEEYKGCLHKIFYKCNKCNHKWKSNPTYMYNGYGCPNCILIKSRLTNEEYIEKVNNIHKGNIIVLDKYINSTTKIFFQCKICEYVWKTVPFSITIGKSGCMKCSRKNKLLDKAL